MDTAANLQFFRSAILDPALESQRSYGTVEDIIVANFSVLEAAHWAQLGARMGYLDARQAVELISSSEPVFNAWHLLRRDEIISPEDYLGRIIHQEQGGKPSVIEVAFTRDQDIDPRTSELLHDIFQTILLLIAEDILNEESAYFVGSIGWADDREWSARRNGIVLRPHGSVQHVGSGFANVLRYWEEMESLSLAAQEHTSSLSDMERATLWLFTENIREVLLPRFNLNRLDVVYRYVGLAGEFVSGTRADSPEWLDARLSAFNTLFRLIHYLTRNTSIDDRDRLWDVFTRAMDSSRLDNERRRRESQL